MDGQQQDGGASGLLGLDTDAPQGGAPSGGGSAGESWNQAEGQTAEPIHDPQPPEEPPHPDAPASGEAPHAEGGPDHGPAGEPQGTMVEHPDGTTELIVAEQAADGSVEVLVAEQEADGSVVVVEVDVDAEGHVSGEAVHLDAQGHVLEAETLHETADGELAVVEVDLDEAHDDSADHHGDADPVIETDEFESATAEDSASSDE
jgi:hypothetical protein